MNDTPGYQELAVEAREAVEAKGRDLPIAEYVLFLEDVIDQLGMSLEAARDDAKDAGE